MQHTPWSVLHVRTVLISTSSIPAAIILSAIFSVISSFAPIITSFVFGSITFLFVYLPKILSYNGSIIPSLSSLNAEEKYQLGLQDGINLTIEKEQEIMKQGFAAEGDYLKGLVDGIHQNPEQIAASEEAKSRQ